MYKRQGQEQTYFLVRCKTSRPKTDLHRSPEFAKTKWVLLQDIKLEMFPKFKRKVIKDALTQFFGKPPAANRPSAEKRVVRAAVSYTHLDVYKRQDMLDATYYLTGEKPLTIQVIRGTQIVESKGIIPTQDSR